MNAADIAQEIDNTRAMMATAAPDERDYLIGRLSALLWVQGGGDVLRTDARQAAVEAWATMQAPAKGDWLTELLQEIKQKHSSK